MRSVIRILALVSFIFSTVAGFGCGAARPAPNADANRPAATPAIDSGRPKIVAFGDSLTAGFGLLEKESYPYLLQEKLKADGYDYEVINAGVSGDTTLGGLERIDWVLEMENIKILILELGANDLMRGVPAAQVKQNLDTIIRKAQARNVRVLLCGMLAPPTGASDYGRDFANVFPDLATKYKTQYLPFLLENVATKKDLNQSDGIHPNAQGEVIMTENIYKELKPMLAK